MKIDNKLLEGFSMEILAQPNSQVKFKSDICFDRRSRESYFAMLKIALRNLSLFDRDLDN